MTLDEKIAAIGEHVDRFNASVRRVLVDDMPRVEPMVGALFNGTPGERADARAELLELYRRMESMGDQAKAIVAGLRDITQDVWESGR